VVFAIESAMLHLARGDADGVADAAASIAARDASDTFPELPATLLTAAAELRDHPAVSPTTRRRLMRALDGTPFAASAAELAEWSVPRPSADAVVAALGLEPLPVEGGLFRQTWRRDVDGSVIGTATFAALTADPDSFSAIHRLTRDEIWHFYLGDPVQMVLLHPDGAVTRPVLGQDLAAGQTPQVIVPAGTWMGAMLVSGGEYAIFGNTMAPGFESSCYEGGTREDLIPAYPAARADIERLTRPGEPTSMPEGL
jgi:predicted cupin superfamily sugar epimerase